MVELIDEKLRAFRHVAAVSQGYISDDFYKIGSVFRLHLGDSTLGKYTQSVIVEQLKLEDFIESEQSPLTKSSHDRPVYYHTGSGFRFVPTIAPTGTEYRIDHIHKPIPPNWTYVIDPTTKNALYNPSASDHQDFELHISEEPNLVIKVLELAGIVIKQPDLYQVGDKEEIQTVQQEKQ